MAKLYFNYSTMNAGKSAILLQADHNYRERGMRTLLLTAQNSRLRSQRCSGLISRLRRRCLMRPSFTSQTRSSLSSSTR